MFLQYMAAKENLLTAILVLELVLLTSQASITCNQSCPGFGNYPYPFGFSAGCEIRLNCTQDAGIFIGNFPVQSIDFESIRVSLSSSCGRPLIFIRQLYSNNHAPTSRNELLLRNCTDDQTPSSCVIPSIQVEARFQAPQSCSRNTTLGCYAESRRNATFLEYASIMKKGWKYLLSSMFAAATDSEVSLNVEVVELEWWRLGSCDFDRMATCTSFLTPNGVDGYRCRCPPGFTGDGFREGLGCHKAGKKSNIYKTVIISILVPILASLLLLGIYWRARMRKHTLVIEDDMRSADALQFDFVSIRAATDDFSEENKLGRGGFGAVYKGTLFGEDIAVKRLSKDF